MKLKNEKLLIEISRHGAEVKRVYHQQHEIDYLWNSNPDFWARSSPILFPIVGRLVQDNYLLNGKSYSLNQHGFARDHKFDILCQTNTKAWFELKSNAKTLEQYPFEFSLKVGYELVDETLEVKWEVVNLSEETMPFSIGAHPAFNTKLNEEDQISDYYLHLESSDGIKTYLFNSETGLITDEKVEIIEKLKLLPLSQELFEEYPVLILEGETAISLKSYHHEREVTVRFDEFPYVGIWSPINEEKVIADFVCIEPWYGIADVAGKPQELLNKKGIQFLEPGAKFEESYFMTFN